MRYKSYFCSSYLSLQSKNDFTHITITNFKYRTTLEADLYCIYKITYSLLFPASYPVVQMTYTRLNLSSILQSSFFKTTEKLKTLYQTLCPFNNALLLHNKQPHLTFRVIFSFRYLFGFLLLVLHKILDYFLHFSTFFTSYFLFRLLHSGTTSKGIVLNCITRSDIISGFSFCKSLLFPILPMRPPMPRTRWFVETAFNSSAPQLSIENFLRWCVL